MTRILINAHGFIGDILFASSVPRKLKGERTNVVVDMNIPLPQPLQLLQNNPYIDNVFVNGRSPEGYDMEYSLGVVDQRYPATEQFQRACGVVNVSPEYEIYTSYPFDEHVQSELTVLRGEGVPIVAIQANWAERTYLYSQEQYELGIDRHKIITPDRNIQHIINRLTPYCALVEVGLPRQYHQHTQESQDPTLYAYTASIIKHCDWMIGSEGGLSNLAAGVGTRTIITTDFLWRQYGPDGHFKQIPDPQMGPRVYFPTAGHVHLSPYLTDDEVATHILHHIMKR